MNKDITENYYAQPGWNTTEDVITYILHDILLLYFVIIQFYVISSYKNELLHWISDRFLQLANIYYCSCYVMLNVDVVITTQITAEPLPHDKDALCYSKTSNSLSNRFVRDYRLQCTQKAHSWLISLACQRVLLVIALSSWAYWFIVIGYSRHGAPNTQCIVYYLIAAKYHSTDYLYLFVVFYREL